VLLKKPLVARALSTAVPQNQEWHYQAIDSLREAGLDSKIPPKEVQ